MNYNENINKKEEEQEVSEEVETAPQEDLEKQVAELKDSLLRSLAEQDNLRKRSEKEKQEASKYAISRFAKDVLNVADNLARALSSINKDEAKDNVLTGLIEGVEMTQKELKNILTNFEVVQIESLDQKFNPEYHQAMMEMENTGKDSGIIVQVLQEGYTISGRLLRPALVCVAK